MILGVLRKGKSNFTSKVPNLKTSAKIMCRDDILKVGKDLKINLKSHVSENCTGLPFTWDPDLSTTQSGPLAPGQTLTLGCQGDDTLKVGDDMVTCVGGTKYKYDVEPQCKGKMAPIKQ